jgi:hypothetical protein
MAFVFTNNVTPTNGSDLMYRLKTLLLSANWILKGNGDATNVSDVADNTATAAGTDYITSAGAMAATNAWWRVRMAGTSPQMEFVFQRGTTNLVWRIKFSPTGFVGGTATATRVPSATDEVVLCGGGTDASPTFTTIFAADGGYRLHIIADNAAPYGWVYVTYPNGGGNPNGAMMLDPLTGTAVGDTTPYAVYLSQSVGSAFRGSGVSLDFTNESGASAPLVYLSTTLSAANFVRALPNGYGFAGGSVMIIPGNTGSNPFDAKDLELPPIYMRRATLSGLTGYKGISSLMRWNGTTRATGDTHTVSTTRDRIIVGDITLPWDGSVPTV